MSINISSEKIDVNFVKFSDRKIEKRKHKNEFTFFIESDDKSDIALLADRYLEIYKGIKDHHKKNPLVDTNAFLFIRDNNEIRGRSIKIRHTYYNNKFKKEILIPQVYINNDKIRITSSELLKLCTFGKKISMVCSLEEWKSPYAGVELAGLNIIMHKLIIHKYEPKLQYNRLSINDIHHKYKNEINEIKDPMKSKKKLEITI